jgi:hypothetical protein
LSFFLQGPKSCTGQIRYALPAGAARTASSLEPHAALHAFRKACGQIPEQSDRVSARGRPSAPSRRPGSWKSNKCWTGRRAYLGVVGIAVADGAEVVEREEDAGLDAAAAAH